MLQQVICYSSVLLYIVMISQVTKEIYVQPDLDELFTDFNSLIRYLFICFEVFTFIGIVWGNLVFLAVRMLTLNQINIVSIEPKRQLATTDTLESLTLLINQYQAFVVPWITTVALILS